MKRVMIVSMMILSCALLRASGELSYAQELKSPDYKIESGTLIFQPNISQNSDNFDVPASFGSDVQKKFEETGHVVIGNKDPNSLERPFIRFKLDKSQLVFESAETGGESTQKSSVNLLGSGSTNFTISIRQQEQFKNSFGANVPPTNCDNNSSKCTPVLAQIWKKVFGFGYRVNGSTKSDFGRTNSFRPLFIGGTTGESAVLLDGELEKTGQLLDLQFKLRPQDQVQTGIYRGTVIITASAGY